MEERRKLALDNAYEECFEGLLDTLHQNIITNSMSTIDGLTKFRKGLIALDTAYDIAFEEMENMPSTHAQSKSLQPSQETLTRTTEGLRAFIMDSITNALNNWVTSRFLSADAKLVLQGEYAFWQQASTSELQGLLDKIPPT